MVRLDPFRSPQARVELIAKYDAILATWPVPYEERDVATSFGNTHIIVSGPASAPPLVLLHGAATTATMWHSVIEAISAAYRCYCVDTITEGNKSVSTQRLRGISDHVVWLRDVLAVLEIQNARIAGLSYGGWLAANLAVYAPEVVDRLVLLCPAATFAPIVPEFYTRMASSGLMRSPELARRAVQWLSATPDAASQPMLDLVVTTLMNTRPARMTVAFPTVLKDEQLRGIKAPAAVFVGNREVIYRGGPQAALNRAQRLIPDVRTRLLKGGHALTVDCPNDVADEMLTALA